MYKWTCESTETRQGGKHPRRLLCICCKYVNNTVKYVMQQMQGSLLVHFHSMPSSYIFYRSVPTCKLIFTEKFLTLFSFIFYVIQAYNFIKIGNATNSCNGTVSIEPKLAH